MYKALKDKFPDGKSPKCLNFYTNWIVKGSGYGFKVVVRVMDSELGSGLGLGLEFM